MKKIDFNIEVPQYKTSSEIIILGDIHRGNRYFDIDLWNRYYIGHNNKGFRNDQNSYVLGIGDLMETAFKDSPGEQDQVEWIEDQYFWIRDMLEPIADEGRLMGLIEGNHEYRSSKNWLRTTRMLARDLGVPYCQGVMTIDLHLKKGDKQRDYKICATHGYGFARTKGGKMNALMRMRDIMADADVYTMGHLHDKINITVPIYINGELKDRLFSMTGAYLQYGGYAEHKLYSPPARGSSKLKFHLDIDRVSGR